MVPLNLVLKGTAMLVTSSSVAVITSQDVILSLLKKPVGMFIFRLLV